jgi:hypothetical protein
VIPPFEASGNLPAGIHEASWNEFAARYGTTPHRRNLLDGLERALRALHRAGCRRAYIDGSFVTAKQQPGDFDACWEASNVDPLLLDPELMDFSDRRRAQKLTFGGELFPADVSADPQGTRFLDHFQRDKDTREPKGIVAIDLRDLP